LAANSHRERLLSAMVQTAARDGYAGASVARVVEQAGVSRATFYQHFAEREACFLAAYRQIVRRMRAVVRAGAEAPGSRPPLWAALDAALGNLASDPSSARVFLVEALAAGPAVRAEHERLIAELEATIERLLAAEAEGQAGLQLSAPALLGGVVGSISIRAFRGDGDPLPTIVEEIMAWTDCYRLPPGGPRWEPWRWRQLGQEIPPPLPEPKTAAPALPRGHSALPVAEVARVRRDRILAATATLTAANGYANLTIADIAASARVRRGAFYSHFRSKKEAFLAVQEAALQESVGATASAFFSAKAWPERVWLAGNALLAYIARNPDLADLCVVESHAAGREALRRQHDGRIAYTVFLEEGYRESERAARLPRFCSDAIACALFALMRSQILHRRTGEMTELLPQMTYVILAPFIGVEEAMEFVEARSRSAGREPPAGR
jgi:AcrR family transcriptional regulator